MSVRDRLLRILEHTATDVIDDMWPDNDTTLDDIAGELLDAYAHELAEKQRAWAREQSVKIRVEPDQLPSIVQAAVDLAADLIDPEATNAEA